jgi:5-formyltetrahydrofolate cyclo-ligase
VTAAGDKPAARAAARAVRAAAHAAAGAGAQAAATARLARALAPHAGKVLAGYMPMRTEIDPLPAMAGHRGPVCVPVIDVAGLPLRFRAWSPGAPLVAGAFGALVPEEGDWLVPAVLIVPLLAFDARGFRLGYGGGFYDRTLAGLRAAGAATAIGFAYAAQQVPAVPVEPTDARLDLVVTEAGVIAP